MYNKLVAAAYEKGKAINAAAALEFDEVIDPKDTRERIVSVLESFSKADFKSGNGRFIDAW